MLSPDFPWPQLAGAEQWLCAEMMHEVSSFATIPIWPSFIFHAWSPEAFGFVVPKLEVFLKGLV